MTDPTAPPVLSPPEGSFGYCAVCYHPLDKCSHCDADAQRAKIARLTKRASTLEDAAFHFQTCRKGEDSCQSCLWFAAFLRGENVD